MWWARDRSEHHLPRGDLCWTSQRLGLEGSIRASARVDRGRNVYSVQLTWPSGFLLF